MTRHYEEEFAAFWAAYPQRPGNPKFEARKEWIKLAKLGVLPELDQMLSAVKKFRAECAKQKTEGCYIPHARTWLHNRRWEAWLPSQIDSSQIGGLFDVGTQCPDILSPVRRLLGPDKWRGKFGHCTFEETESGLRIKTPFRFEVEKIEASYGSLIERLTGKPVFVEHVEVQP